MKISSLLSTALFMFLILCESIESPRLFCGVSNPVEELIWLKQKTEELKQTGLYETGQVYIWYTEYDGETYFIIDNCCPNCNSVLLIYNCMGEYVSANTTISEYINSYDKDINNVIWNPENFSCNL
ncbi:hypothetical protein V8G61_14835 [Gaetbulibacter sp. M240]|uniref:hypothetical protein n=1 Tax=Gaetbulibacter sp. M240 TaxID=3126511 RepID=UPI00374FC3ED